MPTGSGSLHLQQTTIFQERGKAEVWGLALVGDVETHTLDCATCPIRFLQPWVQSAISPEHWHDLELLIHLYLADFIHQVNVWVQQEGLRCEYHARIPSLFFPSPSFSSHVLTPYPIPRPLRDPVLCGL